mgnify:CR=1 FL=1
MDPLNKAPAVCTACHWYDPLDIDTGPIGILPAVVGLIDELKALTLVALPFLTRVY